jgi:hypothetical protein
LISTTISGGKTAGPSAPWPFLKASQAFLEEAFAPLRDDLAWQLEPFSDLFVGEALSGEEDDLGAHDIAIRRRIFSSDCLQVPFFLMVQEDLVWAVSWHTSPPSSEEEYATRDLVLQL